MKNLLIAAISSIYLLSSCAVDCDTSNPEGAASCLCELTMEAEYLDKGNQIKEKELSNKIIQIESEIRKSIDAGNYTKIEVLNIANNRNCMITEFLIPSSTDQY